MNTNLVNIVKQIIAGDYGETVLAEPERVSALLSDLAKDEPKSLRIAFCRCTEAGAYTKLKDAPNVSERAECKAAIARQVFEEHGLAESLCAEALDILEAALYEEKKEPLRCAFCGKEIQIAWTACPYCGKATKPENTHKVVPQNFAPQPPAYTAPRPIPQVVETAPAYTNTPESITIKTLIFALAGGAGGFIAIYIFYKIIWKFSVKDLGLSNWLSLGNFLEYSILSVIMLLLLITAQCILQKKHPNPNSKSIMILLLLGMVTGIFSVLVKQPLSLSATKTISSGIVGLGSGLSISFFIPNYTKKRAILAGFLGGILGGILGGTLDDIGIGFPYASVIRGLIIGLAIALGEEAFRKSWLTVKWAGNRKIAITLGEKPVIFGAGRDADIHIAAGDKGPVRAVVQLENDKVVMYDKYDNQRLELQNGSRVDLGNVSFIVNIKE